MSGRVLVGRCVLLVLAAAGVVGVLPRWAGANVTGISVSVSSGGSCVDAPTPSGFDDAFACSMTEGTSLVVTGSANSNRSSLRLWWSSSGGVSDRESQGALMVETLFGVTTYSRSNRGTLSCVSDGTATLTARDAFDTDRIRLTVDCEPKPSVAITGFDGAVKKRARTGRVALSDTFVVSPSSASCSHSYVSGVAAQRRWTDSSGSGRGLSVSVSALSGTVRVRVVCSATGHTSASAEADFVLNRPDVGISGFGGASRDAPGAMSDSFSVSPASASCSASRSSGSIAAGEVDIGISGAGTSTRTVSVTTTATGSLVVGVTCSRSGYNDASGTATFTARRIAVSVSGFDGASGRVGDELADAFRVRPTTAGCTGRRVGGISAADLTVAVSGTGLVRTVAVESDAAGTASVEVRCTRAEYNRGTARASFVFAPLPDVAVSGFGGASRDAPGAVSGSFSVSPASASCSASRSGGTIAAGEVDIGVSGDGLSARTVDVTSTATGWVSVRVTCSRSGYSDASATATFTVRRIAVAVAGFGGASGRVGDALSDPIRVDPGTASCSARRVAGLSSSDVSVSVSTAGVLPAVEASSDAVGTVTVEVSCTLPEYSAGTARASFVFAPLPDVAISGFDGGSRDAPGAMSGSFSVSPASASCSASRSSGSIAAGEVDISLSGAGLSARTVEVTSTATGSLVVEVTCSRSGHNDASDTATFTARRIAVSVSGLDGASGRVGDELTDGFSVAPAAAGCTAGRSAGIAADALTIGVTGTGSARTVTVESSEAGTATVQVRCTNAEYDDAAVGAGFVFAAAEAGVDSVGAAATSGGECTADSSPASGVDAEWDCWMGIGRSLTVVVTATDADDGLSLRWPSAGVTGGASVSAELGSESFNEATGKHSRSSTATFSCTRDGTARAVTSIDGADVHTALIDLDCRPIVAITDLDDASAQRPAGSSGAVTVSSLFTVSPSSASCSTAYSGAEATVSLPDNSGASRTVAAAVTATSGTVTVQVTCSAPGHAPSTEPVGLTLTPPPSAAVSAAATSGGACTADSPPASGADTEWDCWMGIGRSLTVVVTATSDSDGLSLRWPSAGVTGGASVSAELGSESFNEVTGKHSLSSTATFSCTRDGTARAVTSIGGADVHTALIDLDCRPLVRIDGLDGDADTAAALSDDFEVLPSSASCVQAQSGIAAAVSLTGSAGQSRTVAVSVAGAATGTVTVTVTCSKTGSHAPTTVSAEFVRTGGCSDDLGTLGPGTVTRRGTIAATASCLSWKKGTTASPHYARRFTLRVPAASRLTIDTASSAVDTYLYVLRGSGAAATIITQNEDRPDGGANPGDARIADAAVSPGLTYVIEVTTDTARAAGAFTLTGTIALDEPPVVISGLADGTGWGLAAATVTAAGGFAVEPADASCTAAAAAAGAAPTVAAGAAAGDRTLSVTAAAPFSHDVTVTCDAPGRTATKVTATLAGKVAIGTVTVAAGAACAASTGTADYACTVPRDGTLSVTATAQGAHSGLSLAWTATGGATVTSPTQADVADVPDDEFSRTSAATLACTADGAVTVTVTAGGVTKTVTVSVACAGAVPCDDPLGGLASGATTRTGTIAADPACTSPQRLSSGLAPNSRYARRHTFTLDAPATLTVDVGSASSNSRRLDTYLLLLRGHNAGTGTVLGRDDDGGPGTDSRLAGVRLPAGPYTIEATTWGSRATGSYDLTVTAVLDSATVTVLSGGACDPSTDALPAGVDAVWDCDMSDAAPLRVLANARSAEDAFAHTWTAAGGVTLAGTPETLPRQGPDDADPAYRQASRAALECTAHGTADIAIASGSGARAHTRTYRLDIDCLDTVVIGGLGDAAGWGLTAAALTVTEEFTVSPATAACTAAAAAAGVTPTVTAGTAGARTVSVTAPAPFSHEVTVTCTVAGRTAAQAAATLAGKVAVSAVTVAAGTACAPSAGTADYACTVPRGGALTATATAHGAHSGLDLAWAAAGGATVTSPAHTAAAPAAGAGFSRASIATLACTSDGTVTVTATAGGVTRAVTVSVDCATTADTVTINGLANASRLRAGAVTAAFTVTPHDAACTAAPAAVTVTVTDTAGGRALTATLPALTALKATVTCTAAGHAAASQTVTLAARGRCASPLGTLTHGRTTTTGTVAADAVCRSEQRVAAAGHGGHYAHRHTFTLAGPATVTIALDAAPPGGFDPYLLLLGGTRTTGAVLARNDDRTPSDNNPRISPVRLQAGTYTAEATTSVAGAAGSYTLAIDVAYGPIVIDGLHDATATGTGALTVADAFTVAPAAADCTAVPAAATVTGTGSARTLTASINAPRALDVTVTCTAAGRAGTARTVTLTHAGAVTSLGVRAVRGGVCERAVAVPPGADVAYGCVMAPGRAFEIAADASATARGLAAAWTTTGGVTVTASGPGTAIPSFGFDAATTWHRTATATLACTGTGTATATATLPGAASKTARVAVSCLPAVLISGLADQTHTGSGAVTVTDAFTVAPATAACTTTSGTVTAGSGANRTLSVPLTSPASERVAVTCTNAGRAATTQTVTFAAVERCADHLGTLRPGAAVRSGTIASNQSCTSTRRTDNPGSSVFYARRHTFTLARPARVTIELDAAASTPRLDTYLVLLDGHSPDGTAAALHHNAGAGTGSLLAGIDLAAGSYTIEATTTAARAVGSYDLAISVAVLRGISDSMHVVAGVDSEFRFGYEPADAKLTVPGSAQANATVTLTYGGGSGTLTVTGTAAGTYTAKLHVAVPKTVVGGVATAYHRAVPLSMGGTVCTATQVVSGGDSVCAAASDYSVTITKTDDGNTVTVPASCVTGFQRDRWHLTTRSWPATDACTIPHPNGDRPAQYFVFRVYDSTANVTIRLGAVPSANPQDTYLALYQATGSQVVGGRDAVTVSLDSTPPATRRNNDAGTGYWYPDGYATDSRLQLDLTRGVYVVAATVPPATTPGTTVTASGHFTINVNIPHPGS